MPFPAWPRPLFVPGGGVATVEFVVFAKSTVALEFALLAEGSPIPALAGGLSVQVFERLLASEFGEWADSLAADPEAPPGLDEAAAWYVVGGETASGADFSALQSAWAAVRVILRAGGLAVWDSFAMRWSPGPEALAADPALPALAAAWNVNRDVTREEGIEVVHTLGLTKFGRPDLIAFVALSGAEAVQALVHHIALDLIEGACLLPGDRVAKGGVQLEAQPYRPGENGPPVAVPFFQPPLLLVPVG